MEAGKNVCQLSAMLQQLSVVITQSSVHTFDHTLTQHVLRNTKLMIRHIQCYTRQNINM